MCQAVPVTCSATVAAAGVAVLQNVFSTGGNSGGREPERQGNGDSQGIRTLNPNEIRFSQSSDMMRQQYRPGAEIGNGSTAAAIRYETDIKIRSNCSNFASHHN